MAILLAKCLKRLDRLRRNQGSSKDDRPSGGVVMNRQPGPAAPRGKFIVNLIAKDPVPMSRCWNFHCVCDDNGG